MKLRIWLMATSALLATSAAHAAPPTPTANSLYIAGSQPASLSIAQDSVDGGNTIGTSGTAFALTGPLKTIAITQTGTGNALAGGVKVGAVGSNAANLTQTYGGTGFNNATVNIGASAAPTTLSGAISFTNSASAAGTGNTNTFSETANTGGALTYAISVAGKGNTLTDILSAFGDISNTQTISTDSNTVSNTITGADSIAMTNTINTGASNSVTTTSTGSGAKVVNNTVSSAVGSSTVTTRFNAVAGSQSSILTVTGGRVDFDLDSNAAGTSSTVALTDVAASGGAAKVGVVQTTNAAGAVANLTVVGSGFTTGLIGGSGANANYAVYVNQNTPAAVTNASFTATANNYTVNIAQ